MRNMVCCHVGRPGTRSLVVVVDDIMARGELVLLVVVDKERRKATGEKAVDGCMTAKMGRTVATLKRRRANTFTIVGQKTLTLARFEIAKENLLCFEMMGCHIYVTLDSSD
jgi:hypothetical protein